MALPNGNLIQRGFEVEWAIVVLQKRMLCIFLTKYSFFRRYMPVDTKTVIEDADASVCLRMVEFIALVLENSFCSRCPERK